MHRPAILYALASAALFGVTTPAAKILLGAIDPIVFAGLLYCGAGIGVALLRHIARGTLAGIGRSASRIKSQRCSVARRGDNSWRYRGSPSADVWARSNGRCDGVVALGVGRRSYGPDRLVCIP